MISRLIDQLVQLRDTYGNIEVDVLSDHCYNATFDDVCIRIDEFGDVIAVVQEYDRQQMKYGKFNELIQNDAYMQFSQPEDPDGSKAIERWKAAGEPSRMKRKEIVTQSQLAPIDDLIRQRNEANELYSFSAEENTKLRNKLGTQTFKNTWYEGKHAMPTNHRLLVKSKQGKYFVGHAKKTEQGIDFHIEYELTLPVYTFHVASVYHDIDGCPSWAEAWRVIEFPEDQEKEPKHTSDDCKIRGI